MRHRFSILTLLFLTCYPAPAQGDPSFYDFEVSIDVMEQSLDATLQLSYRADSVPCDSLVFLLHRNLQIESLECPDLHHYAFRTEGPSPFPFIPKAGTLTLLLTKPLERGQALEIRMRYGGKLGIATPWGTNRVTDEWTELGMYAPWFPFQPEMKKLTYRIDLSIDDGYSVFGPGKIRKTRGRWEIRNDLPGSDIIFMAAPAPETREIQEHGLGVDVTYTLELADSTVQDLLQNSIWTLTRYREWFGDIGTDAASIVIAPREKGGGYARPGLVVLAAFDDAAYASKRTDHLRYLAHEFSHLWWLQAPTDSWEDWLNESFAEYSALRVIREKCGGREFLRRMREKTNNSRALPPIMGLNRSHPLAYRVLYDKGCVYLFDLEKEIGQDMFLMLTKALIARKVGSTAEFLKTLEELTDAQVAESFGKKLRR